jgi:hypothetical protein
MRPSKVFVNFVCVYIYIYIYMTFTVASCEPALSNPCGLLSCKSVGHPRPTG